MIDLRFQDKMEMMSQLSDKEIDIVILDPEYGIGASNPTTKPGFVRQGNGDKINIQRFTNGGKDWDNKPPSKEFFDEVFRVSKHQIIFGVNYFTPFYNFSPGRIVWDKLNGETDYSGVEIAYNSLNIRSDVVYYMWSGMMQGIYAGRNIKKALVQQGNKKLNEKRIHPTQKPVLLYKYLLQNYVPKEWLVMDTGFGSASIALACHDYGINLIACENDPDHYKDGVERYDNHKIQMKLF